MRKFVLASALVATVFLPALAEEVDDGVSYGYVGAAGGLLLPGNGNCLKRAALVAARGGWYLDEYLAFEAEALCAPHASSDVGGTAVWGGSVQALWHLSGWEAFDKLFGCDLNTGESVTLEIFENTDAGVSAVSAGGGKLVYVTGSGAMKTMDLVTGESRVDHFGSTVHDPKTDGRITAFLTGFHGEDSALVYVAEGGEPVTVAHGVTNFALADGAIVYGELDRTYVYFMDDGATFNLTRPSESAMFLGGGGDFAIWMDVTWRDRDIIEYMHLNDFSADLAETEEP